MSAGLDSGRDLHQQGREGDGGARGEDPRATTLAGQADAGDLPQLLRAGAAARYRSAAGERQGADADLRHLRRDRSAGRGEERAEAAGRSTTSS